MTMSYISSNDYAFIYNNVPRLCVDLVIRSSDGAILLALRNIHPYKDLWHLPGGGVRFKETLQDTASRIALKEFGVNVKLLKEIGACQTMNDDLDENTPRHSVSIVCEAELIDGIPKITAESADIKYFQTLPKETHPYHKMFIQEHKLL